MRRILYYVLPVIICFALGMIASWLQQDAVENWYPLLIKSPLSPPNSVFGIAWSILYLCMGISIGLVLDSHSPMKVYLARLFTIQLAFNFLWSIFFFYLENPLLGLVDILLLDILVILYILRSYQCNRWSSRLFVPYLIWIVFATYLNFYIALYN